MTTRYFGRAFFITKGKIVRLTIGEHGTTSYQSFSKDDDNFYTAVVAELRFFAQNCEFLCSKVFFRQVAVHLDKSSRFFEVCQELAAANNIPL